MKIVNLISSPIIALIFAPLFAGIIVKVKAFYAGRKGQPIFQVYFNLIKLFKKETVYSRTTSWIFRIAPVVIFILTTFATCFIPLVKPGISSFFKGDVILMLYFLGLAKFFLILSALDTGSAFEGMGASREAFFSALAEPVFFMTLIGIMKAAQTDSIGAALYSPALSNSITIIFTTVPLFILILAENSRIPFDDPSTHLELTMIHEVMILDNSGPALAFLEYAAAVKLWFFSLILSLVLLPAGLFGNILQTLLLVLIMFIVALLIGITESVMPRAKLKKIPQILFSAGVISFLGFFIFVTDFLKW